LASVSFVPYEAQASAVGEQSKLGNDWHFGLDRLRNNLVAMIKKEWLGATNTAPSLHHTSHIAVTRSSS
jgi:hypothetical protein